MAGTSVTVRYFAGARAAAGVPTEVVSVAGGATVDDLLSELVERRGARLAGVLPACSFLVNGLAVHHRAATLPDGAEFDVLPPFAGG